MRDDLKPGLFSAGWIDRYGVDRMEIDGGDAIEWVCGSGDKGVH